MRGRPPPPPFFFRAKAQAGVFTEHMLIVLVLPSLKMSSPLLEPPPPAHSVLNERHAETFLFLFHSFPPLKLGGDEEMFLQMLLLLFSG